MIQILFVFMMIVGLPITHAVLAIIGLACTIPFVCAFMVSAFNISGPAIREFCEQSDTHPKHAWLRQMRRESPIKIGLICLVPLIPYLLWAGLFIFAAIWGIYLVLAGHFSDGSYVVLVGTILGALVHAYALYYLIAIPRRLWVLHRQYRTVQQGVSKA